MKKQILFLTFFIAAVLAGTNAFGQADYQTAPLPTGTDVITCPTPTPLDASCAVVDELHPQPGLEYTYTVTTESANDQVRWFVVNNNYLTTNSQTIMDYTNGILPVDNAYIDATDASGNFSNLSTDSEYILNLGATNNTYNSLASGNHSITIAWKSFNGLQPNEVLLVAYVVNEADCTDNIEVYRVIPEFNFTLDIIAVDGAGQQNGVAGSSTATDCVSPIESAIYASANDVVGDGTLTVDYGENWMFFVINANNFVDSWLPTFEFTKTGVGADITAAEWAYYADATNEDAATYWNTIDVATGATVPVIADGSVTSGSNSAIGNGSASLAGGECIVVRLQVDHGTTYENNSDNGSTVYKVAVDGVMYDNDGSDASDLFNDATNFGDLHTAPTCETDGFTNDWVDYTITPRPQVITNTVNATSGDTQYFELNTGDALDPNTGDN